MRSAPKKGWTDDGFLLPPLQLCPNGRKLHLEEKKAKSCFLNNNNVFLVTWLHCSQSKAFDIPQDVKQVGVQQDGDDDYDNDDDEDDEVDDDDDAWAWSAAGGDLTKRYNRSVVGQVR